MKAVIWKDFGKIEVYDVPKPTPSENEILVRVKAASLCRTDATMIERGILGIQPPVIIGHEVSGVVEQVGNGVEGVAVGQLMALDPPVPCRQCRVCQSGLVHMCPNTQHIGAHIPGGMAEYITIDYRNAYPVPEGVSAEAASLAEPFAVCLEAISRAGGIRGKTVCIFGDGPFGIIMGRLARREQAEKVLLFGHHETRMALVKDYDVATFDERSVDVDRCIRQHTDGYGAQVVIDTTGARQVLDSASNWLMPRGVLVLFTSPATPCELNLEKIHFNELSVVGSCRSLNLFPEALEAIHEDVSWVEGLISCKLQIEQAQHGFELINKSKSSIVKAVISF